MTKRKSTNNDIQNIHIRYSKTNQIKSKSKVLFKVGTFTNSTNISSHELFKPTYILRYKLQHNEIKRLKKIKQCHALKPH